MQKLLWRSSRMSSSETKKRTFSDKRKDLDFTVC